MIVRRKKCPVISQVKNVVVLVRMSYIVYIIESHNYSLYILGERVNLIGPSAVARERLEAADERLLEDGSESEVNTVKILKKAGYDQRKLHRLDEDIFRDCRMLASFFRAADTDSTNIEGVVTDIEKKI